jgi:hypothetical protein
MIACYDAACDPKLSTRHRRMREILAWFLPGAALVMMPKCPACVAAYITLWSGIGLSLSEATYLRWMLLIICVSSLLFLIVRRLDRFVAIFSSYKKETEQCHTT